MNEVRPKIKKIAAHCKREETEILAFSKLAFCKFVQTLQIISA